MKRKHETKPLHTQITATVSNRLNAFSYSRKVILRFSPQLYCLQEVLS